MDRASKRMVGLESFSVRLAVPSGVILRMRYEPDARTLVIVFRGGRGAYRCWGEFEWYTGSRGQGWG